MRELGEWFRSFENLLGAGDEAPKGDVADGAEKQNGDGFADHLIATQSRKRKPSAHQRGV